MASIADREKLLGVSPENIPTEMRERTQWVLWRVDDDGGKVPYSPGRNRIDVYDPRNWLAFARALETYQHDPDFFDGIGYSFAVDDPFVGVDLDSCRDPEWGEQAPHAQNIVGRLDSFTEVSASRTGLHVIVRARLPEGTTQVVNEQRGVEIYSAKRYFAITGCVVAPLRPIAERQDALDALVAEVTPSCNGHRTGEFLGIRIPPGVSLEAALKDKLNLQIRRKDGATYFSYHGLSGRQGGAQPCLIQGAVHQKQRRKVRQCSFVEKGGYFTTTVSIRIAKPMDTRAISRARQEWPCAPWGSKTFSRD